MASIKKNYAYQVLYEVLAIILPIFTAPYVTRTLGADRLGVYAYAFSIVNMFLSVARLGVISHGSRSIASCSGNRRYRSITFWNIYVIQVIATLIVSVIYIAYVFIFINEDFIIYLILGFVIISHLLDISWLYMGVENFPKIVLRNTIVKIISIILIFTLVHSSGDLWIYALIMSGCTFIGNMTFWKDFSRDFDWVKPSFYDVRIHVKPIFVLFVPTIAVTIYTIISKIILGSISGTTEVAYYEYAAAIVSIPLGFITSFGAVILPRLSNMAVDNVSEDSRRNLKEQSLIFVIFLSSAMAFGVMAISQELIPVYYGNEFLPCIVLLSIMSVKLPFMAWANIVRSACLIPNHKDKQFIISLFVGAAISVVVNIILIPRMASVGAVIASVAAEMFVCFVQTFYVLDEISIKRVLLRCMPFGFIGIIMMLCVRYVAGMLIEITIWGLLAEIVVGFLAYTILSILYYSFFVEGISPFQFVRNNVRKILKYQ